MKKRKTTCISGFLSRKRILLLPLLFLNSVVNFAQALPTSTQNEESTPRATISAPLDLLSESLASSTSLISQLMKKNEESGPIASALLSKQTRRLSHPGRFNKKRRRQTTPSPPMDRSDIFTTREPLVFACNNPDDCPVPISGIKYNPAAFAPEVTTEKDVLKTIFRQEVVPPKPGNRNKKPIMRIRKKQRKPVAGGMKEQKVRDGKSEPLSVEAVQMVSAMIKEAGPTLSTKEIDIIADVSQEVGAEVSKEQVKVISMLAEGMGPILDRDELETIATVASVVEEGAKLASESSLEVLVDMAKAKVGQPIRSNDIERMKSMMMSGESHSSSSGSNNGEPLQSGITDHGAEMLTQMMSNLGPEVSAMEVQIVSDMIKELDKDISKDSADVMAEVLKQVDEVSPEMVHNVSAVVSQEEPSLSMEDVAVIGSIMEVKPLSEEVTPEVIETVIEMIEENSKSTSEIQVDVKMKTGEDIVPSDIEMIEHITRAIGDNKATNLVESDLELITMISKSKADSKNSDTPSSMMVRNKNRNQEKDIEMGAKTLSNMVSLFGEHVAPAEKASLKTEVQKTLPNLNDNKVEVMTEILVQMGPEVLPSTVIEVSEMVQSPSVDIRADNVDEVIAMVDKIDAVLEPQEVNTLVKMVQKVGPNLSHREMQMIARMGKQSGVDVGMKEVAMLNQVVQEIGPLVSDNEIKLISMMTGAEKDKEKGLGDVDDVVVEVKELIEEMGKTINTVEKDEVIEVVMKSEEMEAPTIEEAEDKAEMIAEVVQEVGPDMTVDEIEMIIEAVDEADSIDTPEEVGNVTMLVEKVEGMKITAEEVLAISEVIDGMKHFGSGEMRPEETVQATRMAQNLGVDVTPQEVKVIEEIKEAVDGPITTDDAKLVEAISEVIAEEMDNSEKSDLNLVDSEHVAEMVEKVGDHVSPREMNAMKKIIKEMVPDLPNDKIETLTQVLVEVGPSVEPETVKEVSKVVAENEVRVDAEEVKEIADMTRKLSTEMSVEKVEAIADVMKNINRGQALTSNREINQAVSVANRVEDGKAAPVSPDDVQIVSEIIEMLDAEDNSDELELIAVMTKAASQDIFTTENSEKIRFDGSSNSIDETVSKDEAMHIADMVEQLGGEAMTPSAEEAVVMEVMKATDDITEEDAHTAVKIIMNVEDASEETVQEVIETVKDPEVDLAPQSVEKVVEMAQELPKDLSTVDVMVVANLASRMGPTLTQREMMMISRLAKSSNVEVGFKEVAMITEILKEMGPETTPKEAELVEMIVKKSEEKVLDTHAAEEISKLANEIGEFMSTTELKKMKVALKSMAPKLNDDAAAVMTEILNQVGPNVEPEVVKDIAVIAKETSKELTPHSIDMIADMAEKLDATLDMEEIETAVKIVENVGTRLSHREMQMVKQMAQSANITLTTKDVQIINEIVKMIGPDVTEKESKLVAVLSTKGDTKMGNGGVDEEAEELKVSLDAMIDKPAVELEEIQKVEEMISKMEPLLTSSKVQVMSQILIESDPEKVEAEDLRALANVVMEASDDITPGEIEALSEVIRNTDNELGEKEIKVVAEMSAKLGDSLSNREVQMIGRMMRSSGLALTSNDIKSVATMVKILGDDKELFRGDVALLSKMTEVIADSKPVMMPPKKFGMTSPVTVSSLPRKPVVSSLPDKPRIKVNLELKNRFRDRLPSSNVYLGATPPPPVPTFFPDEPEPEEEIPSPGEPSITGFGMKDESDEAPMAPPPSSPSSKPPFPNFPKGVDKGSIRQLVRRPVRPFNPLRSTLGTTTTTEREPEDVRNGINLEEFLMRDRPTPLGIFPSQSSLPGENDVPFAVQPTSALNDDNDDTTTLVKMPGDSFMQITMGGGDPFGSNFQNEILKEMSERPEVNIDKEVADFQNLLLPKPEPTVSKDTLKSVAENFAFAKDQPQSMLMNFLMKKKPAPLPPMPTMPPSEMMPRPMMTSPRPMRISTTTQAPRMMWSTPNPRFKLETSTKLDKSLAGNFINMKMGNKMPEGVKPSVITKLEKEKVSLTPDGNSFMSIQMNLNPDFLMERMSTLEKSFDTKPKLKKHKRPMRKVAIKVEDPWVKEENQWAEDEEKTPFTVRPTLPVGQVKLWPQEIPTKRPKLYTARPKLTSRVWNEALTTATPFTVRPTKTPTPFNYNSNSPYGGKPQKKSHAYVHHDVELKSPFESTVNGFHGNQGFIRDSFHKSHPQAGSIFTTPSTFPDYEIYDDEDDQPYKILQDGYKGIGSLSHPGLHDDRPPFQLSHDFGKGTDDEKKASFGNLKFNLPINGKLPDMPLDDTALLRDLPNIDQLDYEDAGKKGHQYGKSYLKNPYGADFIRLEVDTNRYKHNKTRRIGGIHHIPLKIHGYAETSEFPVSSDTERPLIRHRPRPMKGLRLKKAIRPSPAPASSSDTVSAEKQPLKVVHEAMENLPNAINSLPNIMQSLVTNHASWIDKVWTSALLSGKGGESTGKSFDSLVVPLEEREEEEEDDDSKTS